MSGVRPAITICEESGAWVVYYISPVNSLVTRVQFDGDLAEQMAHAYFAWLWKPYEL